MPRSLVPPGESLRVSAVEPLHPWRERSLRRLDGYVVVVRNQRVIGDDPVESRYRLAVQVEKEDAILIIAIDRAPLVPARSNVPERTFVLEPQRPCHGPRLPRRNAGAEEVTIPRRF